MNDRIVVTGGAGFIGSNFVLQQLQNESLSIINLDKLTYAGNLRNLKSIEGSRRYEFVQGDIADRELVRQLLRKHRPRAIVHFAAESHVDRSIRGPEEFIQTNIHGTFALLEETRAHWAELSADERAQFRFLHVSTDEVYGSLGPKDSPFSETTAYAPNSPYAASKAASDHLVRAYHHTYGLEVTTSNCSNNYGPFHFPEKLIPLMIVNLLHGLPLPIYGDGRNVRDWLHVSDHCRGIDLILENGVPGEVYNIGGGVESENLELVKTLCAVADAAFRARPELHTRFPNCPPARGAEASSLIQFVKDRPGHDRRYAIDCGKIERELGYRAQVSLDAGLRSTFEWYLENEDWWRAVMDGSYQRWIETHYK